MKTLKLNSNLFFALALLALSFTSCEKSSLADEAPEGITITLDENHSDEEINKGTLNNLPPDMTTDTNYVREDKEKESNEPNPSK